MCVIGKMIRAKRKRLGLTQIELGERIGKSGQTISNIERGYTTSLSFDEMALLEKALQFSLKEKVT